VEFCFSSGSSPRDGAGFSASLAAATKRAVCLCFLRWRSQNTVRIRRAGERTLFTWKGRRRGASRTEYEYALSRGVGDFLLALVQPGRRLQKTRYRVAHADAVWDVDVFGGVLTGLILAELELTSEDEPVTLPPWVDREVTADPQYRNSRLAMQAGKVMPRAA
jgi:CYTH domain-containing protein